jgi:SAM-dependent methyltransferase
MTSRVQASVDVLLAPTKAFGAFTDELMLSLETRGLKIDTLSPGGKIMERDAEVGTIQEWTRGKRISILWRPKTWESGATSKFLMTFKPRNGGSTVKVEMKEWGSVLGDSKSEMLGWFAGEVIAPLLQASAPSRFGDWITDRGARRPSGARSRDVYKNPIYHWPNFYAILDVLALRPNENLLEVGCGGGAFLQEALKSGCHASAIDHSPDMVRLASEVNRDSIAEGRLKISAGEADSLPYRDGTFTCAVMTGVLGFLPDALQTFREISRVLNSQGRFVAFTGSKSLRGTPAAPEPVASRLHFYEDSELEDMARRAGFATVRVEHPSLFEYAKKARVPGPALSLFKGSGGSQLLIAYKTQS